MCDFKPGDEVVYIGPEAAPKASYHANSYRLERSAVYVVDYVKPFWVEGLFAVVLVGFAVRPRSDGFDSRVFRKVERKSDSLSIEAFRTIKDGSFEEPRRTNQPDKRKEQA